MLLTLPMNFEKVRLMLVGLCFMVSPLTALTALSEKLNEDDYHDIPDDPLVSAAMEVDQVTVELEGEAGRGLGEVNTTSIKTVLTQDEPQTVDFLYKNSVLASHSEIVSARNSELWFLLFCLLMSVHALL